MEMEHTKVEGPLTPEAQKMEDAKAEIVAVLQKYGCLGVFVVVIKADAPLVEMEGHAPTAPTYASVGYQFEADYSKLKHEGDYVRMSVGPEDYKGNVGEFLSDCAPTVSSLCSAATVLQAALGVVGQMATDAAAQAESIAATAHQARGAAGTIH